MVAQAISVCFILFCLPQTGCCAFLWASKLPFLSQMVSLMVKGTPPGVATSSLLQLSPWGTGPNPLLPLHFFFPFILPNYVEIPLVLSDVWVLLPVFSRRPVRVVPFVDVFLIYLWEEASSVSSCSAILILSVQSSFNSSVNLAKSPIWPSLVTHSVSGLFAVIYRGM